MSDIQDDRGSRKKAWKAFQANYDDVFALSDRECSYCLTDQQVQALLTMTEYLKWSTRWISTTTTIDPDKVLKFATGLEWNLMNGCCDDNLPIQYRYTSEGVLQRSLNGGADWMNSPEYDPRVYSPEFPPLPGADDEDKKCAAATGASLLIREQVGDQLTDDMTRYTLSQLITDWVKTVIETSNPFLGLLTVIANQIFALVIATLRPALTDGVYDTLTCIFYCDMAADATVDDAQWTQIRTDILDQITGIAGVFFEHLVFLLGTTGLTNLLRSGAASTGDCSDCVCGTGCASHYTGTGGQGTIVDRGDNWVIIQSQFNTSPFAYNMARLTSDLDSPDCCTIVNIELISGASYGSWSGFDHPDFTGQHNPGTLGADYCAFQFEQDGAEATFQVKLTFAD